MPKINEYINISKQKPVEIIQEVNENSWWQEKQTLIKKSSLSPSARSKAINKSGSNLQSEKESYGPCEYYGCPYSSRFYLKIQCSYDFVLYEKESDTCTSPFYGITLNNVERARDALKRFEKGQRSEVGGYHLEKRGTFSSAPEITQASQRKQAEIMNKLAEYINIHERGGMVYNAELEIKDGCSIM